VALQADKVPIRASDSRVCKRNVFPFYYFLLIFYLMNRYDTTTLL
jgi:hypothetical protein